MKTALLRPFAPLLIAALLTATGDFLLWPAPPGLALGCFALAVAAALFTRRPAALREWRPLLAAGVLVASAVQTAVELSFSNLLVVTVLLVALLGEILFPALPGLWPRAIEAALVYARAPLRWMEVWRAARCLRRRSLPRARLLETAVRVIAPAALLTGIFALLLSEGNAILARKLSGVFADLWQVLAEFSPLRLLFWLILGTFALGCTCRARAFLPESLWKLRLPLLPAGRDPRMAIWRSWAVLAALNALFFVTNTIDASYLWVHRALPAGVGYSDYVHQGVYALIAAVLLSAFLLVALLQQAREVTGSRLLRALSLLWIAQNIALLASVFLRLRLYVETYDLSTQRVYVGCFLLLVTAGFALLAWRVLRDRDLGWLVSANLLATFALFFLVQFPDVNRQVADYNVARWLREPGRTLDVEYLASLGATAYPALILAAEAPRRTGAHEAWLAADAQQATERTHLAHKNWRSIQLRIDAYARLLAGHAFHTRP